MEQLQRQIKQQEDVLNLTREDLFKEKQLVLEKLEEIGNLQSEVKARENDIEAEKSEYLLLENKIKQVEQRSMQTSKDLQEVYEELT